MARAMIVNSPEYMATLTVAQLRTLAASTGLAHIAAGFAAECELAKRGEVKAGGWDIEREDYATYYGTR